MRSMLLHDDFSRADGDVAGTPARALLDELARQPGPDDADGSMVELADARLAHAELDRDVSESVPALVVKAQHVPLALAQGRLGKLREEPLGVDGVLGRRRRRGQALLEPLRDVRRM